MAFKFGTAENGLPIPKLADPIGQLLETQINGTFSLISEVVISFSLCL